MRSIATNLHQKGFTVLEVLIVIVVIGILAAITIYSYYGSQQNAYDVSVRDDLDAISGQLEDYRANSPIHATYPVDVPSLQSVGIKVTKTAYNTSIATNLVYCIASDATTYALIAQSKSGNFFMMTQDGSKPYTLGLTAFLNTTTLCQAIGSNLSFVSSGWNSGDTTTGPWRTWAGGN